MIDIKEYAIETLKSLQEKLEKDLIEATMISIKDYNGNEVLELEYKRSE